MNETRSAVERLLAVGLTRTEIATRPLEELLVAGRLRSRGNVKRRLLAVGLKRLQCEGCEEERWQGQPIPLDLHHVNGQRDDNRLENLQLFCPNCHAVADAEGRSRSGERRASPGDIKR